MKNLLAILILLLCTGQAVAQDKIYKKDRSVIECKITEVGLDEIKYIDPELEDGPIISISVDDIIKIEFSNGRVIEYKDKLNDPNTYSEDKKVALKLHFLSPIFENLAFSLEKNIKPGQSYEAELGLIGIGFDTDPDNKSSGLFISGGFKFLRTPDFYSRQFKYAHIMKGAYVMPQIILSFYQNKYQPLYYYYGTTPSYNTEERDVVAGAFLINLGKQVVYNNAFLIDYSVGVGYGFSNIDEVNNEYDNYRPYHYGFILGSKNFPIAATAKLKIGILIK
ncbi:hypothetical protein [Fulvivirga lutimaris]|uniref:hypothetical protein n=1 Tax=Fulvivirga lutimaris TaxID=1819566 RepID=UPI0012BB743C|nr:hypothetical protein [Fulvivirga lutimaris]MTI40273.1 hypothetical protein [Fulvivirga lutimaris]